MATKKDDKSPMVRHREARKAAGFVRWDIWIRPEWRKIICELLVKLKAGKL